MDRAALPLALPASTTTVEVLRTSEPIPHVQRFKPNYNDLPWFRYSRSPITAPCWCGNWFIVKSTTALSGVHFASKSYFAIDTVSGADTYGEQLVSSGNCSSFVGLSQVTDDANADNNHTLIRVFTPIEGAIGSAFQIKKVDFLQVGAENDSCVRSVYAFQSIWGPFDGQKHSYDQQMSPVA